jgi:glycosyltransferase involved in cell wall biosynthesis
MQTELITPLIICFNEADNIERCLNGVAWAKRIVVMDSGSTDATLEICARFSNVEVVTRPFDSFAEQCNAGLTHITTPWVLSMDADYIADAAFQSALERIEDDGVDGFKIAFYYCIQGKRLRSGVYPPRVALYRVQGAQYRNDGHGHRIERGGAIADFPAKLDHDDRKPLARWLNSQARYALQEAEKLTDADRSKLGFADRLRYSAVLGPVAMAFYVLFVRGAIFDGWAGWRYTCERVYAELLLTLNLLEKRKKCSSSEVVAPNKR